MSRALVVFGESSAIAMYQHPDFPDNGILWLRWDEATLDFIAQKNRPVFLFVGDSDPTIAPYLRALLRAMPKNAKLRGLLHEQFPALFIEATAAVPEELAAFGARETFHVAVLSPAGLTPLWTIDPIHDNADEVVDRIAQGLDGLVGIWP
jgi:hypothetical protein